MKNLWIYDTEGDDLYPAITKFHCLVFKHYNLDEWVAFIDENHEEYEDAVDFCINSHRFTPPPSIHRKQNKVKK